MSQVCWSEPNPKSSSDEQDRAGALITECAEIEQRQCSWHELSLWNAVLYSNRELAGFRWGETRGADRELWPTNLHTENIIEEIGDAMLSKASSSPLKPTPVPHGLSWKTERAVRLLDEFLFGVWRQVEAEDACVRAYLDSYISCLGCVRVNYDERSKHVSVDPVFFDSVIVDNRESLNRQTPRTVRIRQVLPRKGIEAKWGPLSTDKRPYVEYRAVADGWEVLVEAWRLPDHNGEGGRHVVACCGRLLVDEEWTEEWYPLEFYHWKDRLSGFFCQSGVEQLVPYQVRQNNLNDAIEESQDIACRPRLLKPVSTQINTDQWDNAAGRFLDYSGAPPTPMIWPTNLQELYQERERNIAAAKSHVAMSEMFANADLPNQVRLDSSAGVREFRNMEDSRHLRSWTRFEAFRLRVAKCILKVLGKHSGADEFTAIYHPARSSAKAKQIPWKAVKALTEDKYSWTLEATPLSQQSPAARRETLRDQVSRGLIDDAQARRMLSNPNIEREEDLELASYDDIYRHIDIMEEGGYERPTNLTNLTYGIKKVTANYHRLKVYDDVEDSVMANHEMWIAAAVGIMQAATQQVQQQQMAAAAAPGAAYAPEQGIAGSSPQPVRQN